MRRESTFENAIEFARDLVRIPSPSGCERAVAKRVVAECEALGFDGVYIDEIGNVVAVLRGRAESASVMLSSHLDVVDAGNLAEWEYPPFAGMIAGGYLHGRGAMDCKGPLALQTYAAAALLDYRPAGDIWLLHTVLEESGSWGMAYAMEHDEVHPAAILLGEATDGNICVGHRGRTEITIKIRGKAAHASTHERVLNPLDSLPAVLDGLRAFEESISPHPILGRATLAPTIVESWPKVNNMIPEEVCLVVDWRTLPGNRVEESVGGLMTFLNNARSAIEDDTAELLVSETLRVQRAYTGLERKGHISLPGFLLPASHPLVQAAKRALCAAGREPDLRPWTFGTDGGYSCGTYGVPTIGYGPSQEAYAHTNRERLNLEEARAAYDVYPALVCALQCELTSDAVRAQNIASL